MRDLNRPGSSQQADGRGFSCMAQFKRERIETCGAPTEITRNGRLIRDEQRSRKVLNPKKIRNP